MYAFFRENERVTENGFSIVEEKAAYITMFSSTSYTEVQSMNYEEIDHLYRCIRTFVESAARAKKETKNGR